MSSEIHYSSEYAAPATTASDDMQWYETVFRAHHADLCEYVYRYVASVEIAEDLVQDVFLAVWDDLNEWRARKGTVRPALFVSARNRALDHLKHLQVRVRHQGHVRTELHRSILAVDEQVHALELESQVEAAMAALPERCRLIFSLSREGGRTYAEIAELLGLSVKTVETQMSRALRSLRERLRPHLIASLLLTFLR